MVEPGKSSLGPIPKLRGETRRPKGEDSGVHSSILSVLSGHGSHLPPAASCQLSRTRPEVAALPALQAHRCGGTQGIHLAICPIGPHPFP